MYRCVPEGGDHDGVLVGGDSVASPMILDSPGAPIVSTLLGGIALSAALSLDYWRKRRF